MNSFFKNVFSTVVGLVAFNVIVGFLFLIVLIIVAASAGKSDEVYKPTENTVLHLKLSYQIKDRTSIHPMENFDFERLKPIVQPGLNEILFKIEKAKNDSFIKGIYLDLSYFEAGYGTIEEIRSALLDFKSTGKFVYSYSDGYFQKSYYLATAADSIFMHPMGYCPILGISSEVLFFSKAFKKLDIEPQIFRHGKFKGAIEPLINEELSAENELQIKQLIKSIWDDMCTKMADARGLSVDDFNDLADGLKVRTANEALSYGLVDRLVHKDEVKTSINTALEQEEAAKISFVKLHQYTTMPDLKASKKDKVAVIYAEGEIVMGEGETDQIGEASLCKTIREARKDESIKSVVIRVNSGGGSALASEKIWREIYLTTKEKPVIASMGTVAASGGYYMIACADTIVADPNTITGSIGVFGVFFTIDEFLEKKLGITRDVVNTNNYSDFPTAMRPLSMPEKDAIQLGIEEVYSTFLERVSSGRDLSVDYTDSIAQGRVWSGLVSKEIGLADVLGGLNTAIEIAADKADLEDYTVVALPKNDSPFAGLFGVYGENIRIYFLKKELGDKYNSYIQAKEIIGLNGIQFRSVTMQLN